MCYLYKNGEKYCKISNFRFYKGDRKIEIIRTKNDDYSIPGNKEPDRVTFICKKFIILNDHDDYRINLNNGFIYDILIDTINGNKVSAVVVRIHN